MENKDFKYLVQDFSNLYLGKELTYDDIWNMEDTPFKLKAILNHYILKDVPKDTRMIDHLCELSKQDISYFTFEQLKLQIKLNYIVVKKNIFKKTITCHVSKSVGIKEFMNEYKQLFLNGDITLEEMVVSKLALMAFSV